ncbi:MAG: polyhydroxyalkanoate synthesis regulator DNA-binding domain-containing protein [Kofleriaceae bacterium]
MATVLIKKYGNRRLYDTGESRYITQDELAQAIKRGTDVRVVDAKTGDDLTQATLAQLVLENAHAARALPVALLTQLIRLDDDALVEFFGRYVTSALELYLAAKRGVQSLAQSSPLMRVPLGATDALTRMWMQSPFAQVAGFGGFPGFPPGGYPGGAGAGAYEAEPPAAAAPPPDPSEQLAAMRRELDELKKAMRGDGVGKPGAKRKPRKDD